MLETVHGKKWKMHVILGYFCSIRVKYLKSSDAKASKCHLKFSSKMIIFIKLVYLSSVISLKWQW